MSSFLNKKNKLCGLTNNPIFSNMLVSLVLNTTLYQLLQEISKTLKKLKVRNESRTFEKALDDLIKFTKGQGNGDLSNLTHLKQGLGDEDKAILETNVLNRVFEKSLIENITIDLSVFDSKKFLDELDKIKGAFESKEAMQFLEQVKGFNRLFNQDAEIARAFKNSLTQKEGANIATSL